MKSTVSIDEIYPIIYQNHRNPFQVLGPHLVKIEKQTCVSIRAFLPQAKEAFVCSETGTQYPMIRLHEDGFFEALCREEKKIFSYKIKVINKSGETTTFYDSYSFPPALADFDLYLMQKGEHHRTYEKLGAHQQTIQGVSGVYFSVWAPNARSVSVIGSFNGWDSKLHVMRSLENFGVWEIFIPGIGTGTLYKYKIITQDNYALDKTDPHGFYSELSPQTASIVYDIEKYEWQDGDWMGKRKEIQAKDQPMSIYEVHLGSWKRDPENNSFLSYRDLAHQLVDYVKDMGYTHLELLPILEHPFYGSWGYQVIGHYSPTSRYGEPDDFMYFVDYCHQNGVGVLLDWVPAHFPKDLHGLGRFDGTHLYEHADPRQREHLDWDTFIYNYGRNEVKNYLISNALFWLDKYHIDGLRIDAVASMIYLDYSKEPGQWVPNKYGGRENLEAIEFVKETNALIARYYPDTIVIAEDSTAWPGVTKPIHTGGLGFTYKWNMGWMNDTLKYMGTDPIYRKYKHSTLPFSIWYAFNEDFVLPLSHDEVVHGKRSLIGKMPGNVEEQFSNLRLLLAYMFAHPGKKMLFMGNDFAQWKEWAHDFSLDWHLLEYEAHQQIQQYVKDLNHFYRKNPALYHWDHEGAGFEWIDFHDSDFSVISFIRKAPESEIIFVFNFTPVTRYNYQIGVQDEGYYQEVFNSDGEAYGGKNEGNMGGSTAEKKSKLQHEYSLSLTLPPLGMVAFKSEEVVKRLKKEKEKEAQEKRVNTLVKKKPEENTSKPEMSPKEQKKIKTTRKLNRNKKTVETAVGTKRKKKKESEKTSSSKKATSPAKKKKTFSKRAGKNQKS